MSGRPPRRGPPERIGSSAGARPLAERLRSTRGRSTAQQAWLTRQLNDPYVAAARAQGLRSRAAFKLMELDDRFHIIPKGGRVLDLGAAPGGWSQVCVARGAARVVGIDLLPMDPVPGAAFTQGDLRDAATPALLTEMLGGPADLVLSDMAPNTTGHGATDHIRIVALAELALDLAGDVLMVGGGFVAKVFQGGTERQMLVTLRRRFTQVRHAKPPASRRDSSELYVVASGFRGA